MKTADPHSNPANTSKILIIEDERDIRRFLRTALETHHYQVLEAETLKQGLTEAAAQTPDLVILDLGLPDGDGTEFIHDFRHWSKAPVLVLSARSAEQQKIAALDAGADDYLGKPFSVGELLARVRALLRRQHDKTAATSLIKFADIEIDLARHTVTRGATAVHLTRIEYELLAAFVTQPDRVLTYRQLLKQVWGPAHVDSNHYLRIYVGHLRQKLEQDPVQPKHFLTETGIGYRFQP